MGLRRGAWTLHRSPARVSLIGDASEGPQPALLSHLGRPARAGLSCSNWCPHPLPSQSDLVAGLPMKLGRDPCDRSLRVDRLGRAIYPKPQAVILTSGCLSPFFVFQLSVQFSPAAQLYPILCDPMICSTPGLPVCHQLPEFTQIHVHRVSDAIQPSQPLSSPSPPGPNPP